MQLRHQILILITSQSFNSSHPLFTNCYSFNDHSMMEAWVELACSRTRTQTLSCIWNAAIVSRSVLIGRLPDSVRFYRSKKNRFVASQMVLLSLYSRWWLVWVGISCRSSLLTKRLDMSSNFTSARACVANDIVVGTKCYIVVLYFSLPLRLHCIVFGNIGLGNPKNTRFAVEAAFLTVTGFQAEI